MRNLNWIVNIVNKDSILFLYKNFLKKILSSNRNRHKFYTPFQNKAYIPLKFYPPKINHFQGILGKFIKCKRPRPKSMDYYMEIKQKYSTRQINNGFKYKTRLVTDQTLKILLFTPYIIRFSDISQSSSLKAYNSFDLKMGSQSKHRL